MSDAFDSIERGLKEALTQARGKGTAKIHKVDVPDLDVKAIRAGPGQSQDSSARSIGVDKTTLRDWERGRRRPEGNARVLLAMIAGDPRIAHRALGGESAAHSALGPRRRETAGRTP